MKNAWLIINLHKILVMGFRQFKNGEVFTNKSIFNHVIVDTFFYQGILFSISFIYNLFNCTY